MPKYSYTAKDSKGIESVGKTEALDLADAVRSLRAKGLNPVKLNEVQEVAVKTGSIKPEDLEIFCQQMATMSDSGLPMSKSISALGTSSSSKGLRAACASIVDGLGSGLTLDACVSRHPEVFDGYFQAMVKAGEATGRLPESFARLCAHLEFQREISTKTKAALRYPITVMGFMVAALFIVNIFVIPAFGKAFASFGAELPYFTKLLLAFSHFMVDNWKLLLGAAAGLAMGARAYVKTKAGALAWAKFKIKMPLFGELAHKAALARYCAALAAAYAAGMPIYQAVALVADTSGNAWMGERLKAVKPSLERGRGLVGAFAEVEAFTPLAIQMVAVGEETGRLDDQLNKVASMYRQMVDRDLRALSDKIEPIMMVFLGALVLVLALGILLPIWDLSSVALQGLKK
jgi:MSHA biogenesis protein MshG